MLGSYPVDVMVLATDLGVASSFYGEVLGLPVLLADEGFLAFGAGGDSRLVVTQSSTGTAEARPPTGWCVAGGRR
jgi:catechol-2,3-dioxygenase